ncbi:hypothetical protein MSAN_00234300 [Mycena sanguinolenta]|uniref:F-box domain-containing protein n=1 Tax=Mycena sanguinolenta TaxID=230812 RepID=A0A8H7DNY6_9AGAR|nr:hypothetical protein MSAN_00234300 [Mycena sanguinolenta]
MPSMIPSHASRSKFHPKSSCTVLPPLNFDAALQSIFCHPFRPFHTIGSQLIASRWFCSTSVMNGRKSRSPRQGCGQMSRSNFRGEKGFDKLLEVWISRARHRPLSISLHGSLAGGPDIAPTFGRWSHQLHNLELYPTQGNDLGALFEGAEPFLALKSLTIGFEEDHGRVNVIGAVLKMLRLAPTLEECTLNNVFSWASDHHFHPEPLVLPHLRFLDLPSRHCRDDDLIKYLTLPNLETLTVSRINWGTLDNFLGRSSPPLRNLSIRQPNSLSAGFEFFNLIPSCMLVHLDLQYETMGKDVLNQLGVHPPEECFPNLHTLRIMNFSPKSFSADILSAALGARRGHHIPLQALVLMWRTRAHAEVRGDASNIVAALREFADDGMKIHVGTKSINMMTRAGGKSGGTRLSNFTGEQTSTAAA